MQTAKTSTDSQKEAHTATDSHIQAQSVTDKCRLFGKLDRNARFIVCLYELHGPNFSEGLRARTASGARWQRPRLPSPISSCGLSVLRCLDDISRGVLWVRSAAASG